MSNPTIECPPLDKLEHRALIALSKGEASADQQTLALTVIVKKFAQPQDLLYVPGRSDETAFLNGRAFVASRIRYYVNAPVEAEEEV